jgi:hypothetical protein
MAAAAAEQVDRIQGLALDEVGAINQELFQFMQRRMHAAVGAMLEMQRCHSLLEIWQVQLRFSQTAMQDYAGEAAKLAGLALATGREAADRLRLAA